MARPPKAAEFKALAGNPGKRAVQRNAADAAALKALAPDQVDSAAAPKTLSSDARKVWAQEIPRILRGGLVKTTDYAAFGVYCEAVARYRKANAVIAKRGMTVVTPTGFERERAEVKIAERAERTILAFQRSLGLTTDSRIAAAHRLASAGQYRLPLDPTPAAAQAAAPAPENDPVGYIN